MYPLGTRVTTASGFKGKIVALFADGVWAKKFLDCPKCDRATWEINTAEADFTEDSHTHSLIEDREGRWHIVDDARVFSTRARVTASGVISA